MPMLMNAGESAEISVEKRLPTHLYAHKSNICHLPDDLRVLVAQALLVAGEFDYNLVKIAHDGTHVCLLCYPDFDKHPHPALKYSIKVLLSSSQCCVTDYSRSTNPPILHCKETFVSPEYPLYTTFVSLTKAEAKYGLLGRSDIGHRKQWKALLASKNLIIRGHKLSEKK